MTASPRFPAETFAALAAAGVTQPPASVSAVTRAEVRLVRAVAAADASTARILDGHFNGVERVALSAPSHCARTSSRRSRAGELLLGVWGADPARGEGSPARIDRTRRQSVLRGVKTFCSGAGGVQRALVIARDAADARRLAYVDVRSRVHIDRDWYRASGLRSSESHRVEFADTRVLALLGGEDELMREPWFSRDAVRTASTWAGIADCILEATLAAVGGHKLDDDSGCTRSGGCAWRRRRSTAGWSTPLRL